MNYRSLEKGKRKNQYVGERFSLAFDSFIYFTNAMETVSAVICGIFLLLSVGMRIFVAKDLIFHNVVVEGWISTMSFRALGFFGVFALLTIILKPLHAFSKVNMALCVNMKIQIFKQFGVRYSI